MALSPKPDEHLRNKKRDSPAKPPVPRFEKSSTGKNIAPRKKKRLTQKGDPVKRGSPTGDDQKLILDSDPEEHPESKDNASVEKTPSPPEHKQVVHGSSPAVPMQLDQYLTPGGRDPLADRPGLHVVPVKDMTMGALMENWMKGKIKDNDPVWSLP